MRVFKRNYISKQEIPILLAIAVILIIIINSLNNNRYLLAVILLLPFLLFLLIYIVPNKIEINNKYIQYGKNKIIWEDIDNVLFTVNKAGPFIQIRTEKQSVDIFWKDYQNYKELRE